MVSKETLNPRQLCIVIPTYNEAQNLPLLISKIKAAVAGIDYEIIVVDDDSPDKTWQIAENLAKATNRIHVIRRVDEKGLSSAIVMGMKNSHSNVIAVMDADMQHDETRLPAMFQLVSQGDCDICVGSREARDGGYGNWSISRKIVSFTAKKLAFLTLGSDIKDPMSGFFAISQDYFNKHEGKINPSGFKILLELVYRGKEEPPVIKEVGYQFKSRIYGETKLNATIMVEYLLALIDLSLGWVIPNGFVKFGMVGMAGSLVNFLSFAFVLQQGAPLQISVFIGAQLGIIWSYLGNNFFTFSRVRYKRKNLLKGLLLYEFTSLYGLFIQLAIVSAIMQNWPQLSCWLITTYLVYLVGVGFGAVGNYFIHTYFTWNRLGYKLLVPTKS